MVMPRHKQAHNKADVSTGAADPDAFRAALSAAASAASLECGAGWPTDQISRAAGDAPTL
eukprot:gene18493-368_t